MAYNLLLVFIHGFRGSDTCFKDFPNWLNSSLAHTLVGTMVKTVVYPSYKTAGELSVTVQNFCAWLSDQIKDEDHVDIVLLGHSMGGIVGAEAILFFDEGRRQQQPHKCLQNGSIIALLSYDTPFYSINEGFISKAASTVIEKIDRFLPTTAAMTTAAASIGTSNNHSSTMTTPLLRLTGPKPTASTWGWIAGVAGALGLATLGYLTRDLITSTATSAFDHLEFVSALMDTEECHKRMKAILSVPDMFVQCFYVKIPPSTHHGLPKTFIALPPPDTMHVFIPMVTFAESEIMAHITIFDPRKNDHYYTVGSDSIALIADTVLRHGRKRQQHDTSPNIPAPSPSSSVLTLASASSSSMVQ